ncbi:MAG: hypothetical protein MUP85_09650 [Candidatus Lokiarchaeota archaeon]|nr:hypothetical protein [Candidatus Lokiarchaeota archaeon]
MIYGRRIIKFENGQPVFSNEISNNKLVGEILLEKHPKDNICNICLDVFNQLTGDHVPPKCMGNKGRIHYVDFLNYLLAKPVLYKGFCQNGIKYETICESCNKIKLKAFDDEIKKLFITLKKVHNSKIILKLEIKPNKIIRGILGHFLSAKTTHQRSDLEELFAKAVNDVNSEIDNSIGFYVLPYFNKEIRVIRDLLINGGAALVNVLKISPLAFIVTNKRIFPQYPNWHNYFSLGLDTLTEVEFFSVDECLYDWPERYYPPFMPGLTCSESVIGVPE